MVPTAQAYYSRFRAVKNYLFLKWGKGIKLTRNAVMEEQNKLNNS